MVSISCYDVIVLLVDPVLCLFVAEVACGKEGERRKKEGRGTNRRKSDVYSSEHRTRRKRKEKEGLTHAHGFLPAIKMIETPYYRIVLAYVEYM